MDDIDPFKELGVSRNATDKEVKRAYYKLSKIWHPDKNKDPGAEEKFKRIAYSYSKLKTQQDRNTYVSSQTMPGGDPFGAWRQTSAGSSNTQQKPEFGQFKNAHKYAKQKPFSEFTFQDASSMFNNAQDCFEDQDMGSAFGHGFGNWSDSFSFGNQPSGAQDQPWFQQNPQKMKTSEAYKKMFEAEGKKDIGEVVNIKNKVSLNGSKAEVLTFDQASGRYICVVRTTIKLKPENIKF